MAHARRKFTDSQKSQPTKKVGKAEKALNYIGQRYGIEQERRDLSAHDRQKLQEQKAKPISYQLH